MTRSAQASTTDLAQRARNIGSSRVLQCVSCSCGMLLSAGANCVQMQDSQTCTNNSFCTLMTLLANRKGRISLSLTNARNDLLITSVCCSMFAARGLNAGNGPLPQSLGGNKTLSRNAMILNKRFANIPKLVFSRSTFAGMFFNLYAALYIPTRSDASKYAVSLQCRFLYGPASLFDYLYLEF